MTYTRPVVVDLGDSLLAVVPVSRMLAALVQLAGLLRHDQRKDKVG